MPEQAEGPQTIDLLWGLSCGKRDSRNDSRFIALVFMRQLEIKCECKTRQRQDKTNERTNDIKRQVKSRYKFIMSRAQLVNLVKS